MSTDFEEILVIMAERSHVYNRFWPEYCKEDLCDLMKYHDEVEA